MGLQPREGKEEKNPALGLITSFSARYRLTPNQAATLKTYARQHGTERLQQKMEQALADGIKNPPGFLLRAVEQDWPDPVKRVPKTKKPMPAEPTGWREALRAIANRHDPPAEAEAWPLWKNVPRSLQVDVLAELANQGRAAKAA